MGDMADYTLDSMFEDDDDYTDDDIPHRPGRKTQWLEIEVKKIIAATGKAFLCRLDDDLDYWIPFSQMQDHEDFEPGDTECVLHITEWINDRLEPAEKRSIFDKRAKGEADE